MATRLKPTRINVDNTPRVWDGASYQNDDNFRWSAWWGDMEYRDFEWVTLTWNSLVIQDISNNITPSSNFTVSAGTVKPGIEYVLRVNTGNTPYTMTLWTGVINPNSYKTELKPNTVNQFKFIATSTNQLELEGVDSAVVSEINWGEIDGTLSNQTDLQNALDEKADTADINTKTFFLAWLSWESNLATAQEAYDWYIAGKYPLISYQRREYILKEVWNVNMQFYSQIDSLIESNNGITKVRWDLLVFTLSSWTVTAINLANRDIKVLATGTNYSTPYTPEYDGSPVTKKYSDYWDEKITSRGENLVTNWFANLWNNYNFEWLDYEGADTYWAWWCFSKTSDNRFLPKTEEFMPIDITKIYRLSYAVKNSADTSTYDCLYMFDIDKNQINTWNTNWTANTTTTLAQELKNWDTVVYLTDTTNWDTSDNQYRRGLIFWNYKNSFGYQYPIETYSRNWWYNLWADSSVAIDKVNNTITLRNAWNHWTFPAWTSLSQSAPSGWLTYGNSNYKTTPWVWTVKEAIFTPDMFRTATSYVKIGWLCNYSTVENATVKFSSVSFTQNALLSDFTNTKVFTLTSSSDLTNAQKAYDEYQAGNNVVVNYGWSLYAVNNVTSARMNFYWMKNDIYVNRGQWDSALQSTIMYFALSSWTVTSIVANNSAYFYTLSTAIDYDTPYTPQYPWSPATKKYVDDAVANLMAMWKFLSLWNCATWQPISFPLDTPYTYHTGDYFMVETVDSTTNYKPNGSSYTGTASTTIDSDEVAKWDFYVYDGTTWLLATNHWKTVSFANLAGQPSDNTALSNALSLKQDTLTAWTWIAITSNTISNSGVTSVNSSTWDVTVQDTLVNQSNIKSVNWNNLLWSWNIVLFSVIQVTLAAASWSSEEITVTATWVTASNHVIVSPDPSSITDYADALVYCSNQASNSLTFKCTTAPENDITVNVLIIN